MVRSLLETIAKPGRKFFLRELIETLKVMVDEEGETTAEPDDTRNNGDAQ